MSEQLARDLRKYGGKTLVLVDVTAKNLTAEFKGKGMGILAGGRLI